MAACSAKHLIWTILRKNRGLWTVLTILLDLIWLINLFVCLFFFKRQVYLRCKAMDLNVSTCSLKDYPLTNYDTWSNFETTEIGLYFVYRTHVKQKDKNHETIPSRFFSERKTKKSFVLSHPCPVHEQRFDFEIPIKMSPAWTVRRLCQLQ